MTEPGGEPVRWRPPLALPVLGVTTTFLSNSEALLDRVRETYGGWGSLAARADLVTASPVTVRLVLTDPPPGPVTGAYFRHEVPNPTRLLVHSDTGSGWADAARHEAVGHVTPELLSRPADLSEGLLEALTLFLVSRMDRQPLHAAAIVRGSAAILLEGRSGVGKSTLAYAASRCGFAPLSDEAVYVQMDPLRVWSRRSRVHLRLEARAHFPELAAAIPTVLPGGKTRIVRDLGGDAPWPVDRMGVCLLERGPRVALRPIGPAEAADVISARLAPGFDLHGDTVRACATAIASRGAWSLTLGSDPFAAMPLLEEVAGALAGSG